MRQVVTDRRDVRELLEAAEQLEGEFQSASLGYLARSLSFVFAGAGSVTLDHKLGKTPTGWFLVDLDAAATIHRAAWDTRTLTLASSGACNARVLVL